MSDNAPRQHWLAVLARAPADFLEQHLGVLAQGSHQWLRPAETGLVMVRARAGGTGQRFNLGEATVTRCVVRPDPALTGTQQVGVGYVLGCSHRQALLAQTQSTRVEFFTVARETGSDRGDEEDAP